MSPLLFEKRNRIGVLTLNRPARLNVLAEEGDGELFADMAKNINADGDLRCVIVTGAGSAFSAGGNVKEMRDKSGMFAGSPETIRANYLRNVHPIVRAIWDIEVPLIAAVNGAAVDSATTWRALPISASRPTPRHSAPVSCVSDLCRATAGRGCCRNRGLRTCRGIVVYGGNHTAQTALSWGLVSRVVVPDRLMGEAQALAAKIARQPPGVLRMTKKLLREAASAGFRRDHGALRRIPGACGWSEDHADALAAFFEKRDPVFKGRLNAAFFCVLRTKKCYEIHAPYFRERFRHAESHRLCRSRRQIPAWRPIVSNGANPRNTMLSSTSNIAASATPTFIRRATNGAAPYFPMVPGHEIVGVVTRWAATSEIQGRRQSRRRLHGRFLPHLRPLPARSRTVLPERLQLRPIMATNRTEGTVTQGGYSDKIVVDENYVLRVPDNLPLDAAAPLLCAGITLYSPLSIGKPDRARMWRSSALAGLAIWASRSLMPLGAEVTVLSHSPKKEGRRAARRRPFLMPPQIRETFKKLANSFDLIIYTVGTGIDWNQYLELLKLDGDGRRRRARKACPSSAFPLVGMRRSLAGPLIGGIKETQDMLDFCGAARHRPAISRRSRSRK